MYEKNKKTLQLTKNQKDIRRKTKGDPEQIHILELSVRGFKITGINKFKNLNNKMKSSTKEMKTILKLKWKF